MTEVDTTSEMEVPHQEEPYSRTFFLGLDLGQTQDYSAVAVVERLEIPVNRREVSRMLPARDQGGLLAATRQVVWDRMERYFHVRYLDRFPLRTPYPVVVEQVVSLLTQPELKGNTYAAVDATGVGAPVVDLLRDAPAPAPICAITITGGDTPSGDGSAYRVPKRDLASTLQVLLQSKKLGIAATIRYAQTLVEELMEFEVRVSAQAHDAYGVWRSGVHDDLVLAVAIACWLANRPSQRLEPM